MIMEEVTLDMLDMEAKLMKDKGGSYRKEIMDRLSEYSAQVKKALDSGLSPAEFQDANRLKDAVDAASTVVDKVWKSIHG